MLRYVCLNCFHDWTSNINRGVLRCPKCHRRQGVSYDKFRKAVEAAKAALRKVTESPPPHPPPLEAFSYVPKAMEPVLEIAKKEFPSPLVPFALSIKILGQAIKELKNESSQRKKGGKS